MANMRPVLTSITTMAPRKPAMACWDANCSSLSIVVVIFCGGRGSDWLNRLRICPLTSTIYNDAADLPAKDSSAYFSNPA